MSTFRTSSGRPEWATRCVCCFAKGLARGDCCVGVGNRPGRSPTPMWPRPRHSADPTDALRRALLVSGQDAGVLPDAPGLIVLEHDERADQTPSVEMWLDDFAEKRADRRGSGELSFAVQAVVTAAREKGRTAPALSRVRGRSGRWMTVRAWSTSASRVVIGVGPADFGELVSIVLDPYGLTPREREVTQLVLRGIDTAGISKELRISVHTVQDHLKVVFLKTATSSRRQLVAKVFFEHCHPSLGRGPLVTDGRRLEA